MLFAAVLVASVLGGFFRAGAPNLYLMWSLALVLAGVVLVFPDARARFTTVSRRVYDFLFPRIMPINAVADRALIVGSIYLAWVCVGIAPRGWLNGLCANYGDLSFPVLAIPGSVLATAAVIHRRYRDDLAAWQGEALSLSARVAELATQGPVEVGVRCHALDGDCSNLLLRARTLCPVPGVTEPLERLAAGCSFITGWEVARDDALGSDSASADGAFANEPFRASDNRKDAIKGERDQMIEVARNLVAATKKLHA